MAFFKSPFFTFVLAFLLSLAGPTYAATVPGHLCTHKFSRVHQSTRLPHVNTTSTSTIRGTHATMSTRPTNHVHTHTSATHLALNTTPTSYSNNLASSPSLIPNNIKAGVAGGDAYTLLQNHIGWWYDWSANPSKPGRPIAVPMLWGSGRIDHQDASRFAAFQRLSASQSAHTPSYVLGYEEPDCKSGSGSSDMSIDEGVRIWETLIAPLKERGTKIGSPSMCKQADETWLKEFAKKISTPWDFTAVHVNKDNMAGVKKDIDYYWSTYRKPIWVTEFACVNDHNTFRPCTDQNQINSFIHQVVDYFEHEPRVYAYAFSNGLGLGDIWPMMRNGVFSESGKAYLSAISKYH